MSRRRIWALILRQLYVLRRSWTRITDLFYWPLVDLFFFGFLSVYLSQSERIPRFVGLLVGALILWDIFFRVQQGISVSFLMELWARNLVNLFVTPLTVAEFLMALMVWGVMKIFITVTLMASLAWVLWHFSIFTLGFNLIPFVGALIVFAWAVGMIITAIILRYGPAAETLAWSLALLFQPFGAVFFPLSTYPQWLASILTALPLTYVFEGMRTVLGGRAVPVPAIARAFALDAVYLAGAFAFFGYMFTLARRRGLLLKTQE